MYRKLFPDGMSSTIPAPKKELSQSYHIFNANYCKIYHKNVIYISGITIYEKKKRGGT